MIIFEVINETSKIIQCETEYLEKCRLIIESYRNSYSTYGCEINYGLFWRNGDNNIHTKRPPVEKNYECWFGYEITKNGQCVCYDNVEGYTLGESEGFLFARKKKGTHKNTVLEVKYINDISSLKDSLEKDFLILKDFFANT